MFEPQEGNDLLVQRLSVYTEQADGAASARIEEVDLRVRPGEWVALVGVNGSGKSTLARVLAGLAQDGAVGMMKRGFAGAGPAAYVMQQPDAQLFGETPREELTFALEWLGTPADDMESRVRFWLERAGLSALADEPWKRLSGGQRQLAAVAAATAGRSPLVIFDEATSMLDAVSAERVMSMARELHADGAAVVWVTQRLEELAPQMRVVAMKDGRIAYDGNGREFFYGQEPHLEEAPCVRCGLRLPYLAELALELYRGGALAAPLPMTPAEWRELLGEEMAWQGDSAGQAGAAVASWPGESLAGESAAEAKLPDARLPDASGANTSLAAASLSVARNRPLQERYIGLNSPPTLTLRSGEVTVLLGANGAGKTNLLELAGGLRDPNGLTIAYGEESLWLERGEGAGLSGRKRVGVSESKRANGSVRGNEGDRKTRRILDSDGGEFSLSIGQRAGDIEGRRSSRTRRRLNPVALRRYAYASQAPEEQLICRTAEEELREALRPYRLSDEALAERIAAALVAVGWDASRLSQDPYRMSGGERRRLALACLFAVPASWLLIDEPTAGLDAAGQRLLAEQLRRLKGSETGVLLVSHESEWSLPLADRVLLLSPEGVIRDCTREELLLHPEWWSEAGMEIPAWLETVGPFLRQGVPPHCVWNPAEVAREWIRIAGGTRGRSAAKLPLRAEQTSIDLKLTNPSDANFSSLIGTEPHDHQRSQRFALLRPRLQRTEGAERSALILFDPRSVWLSYVLLSLAIFTVHSWLGLAMAGGAAVAAVLLGRIPLWRWRGLIAGYLLFSLMVSAVAGIGSGGAFAPDAFLTALHSLAQTFAVMILGLGLALAITPLRLRRSLEQLLSVRGRQTLLVQKIILIVTLMLRFIPMFLDEWNRFARYAIARSKEASLTPGSVPRRLRSTALPFLLSLFRLGDQVTDALESRGVGMRARKAVLRSLKWRKRDSALALGATAVAVALWMCG